MFEDHNVIKEKNVEIKVPNDYHNLLIFIYETAGRDKPRFRDIIDFHYMRKSVDKSLIDEVYKKLKSHYLKSVMKTFIKIDGIIDSNKKCSFVNRLTSSSKCELFHTLPTLIKGRNKIVNLHFISA